MKTIWRKFERGRQTNTPYIQTGKFLFHPSLRITNLTSSSYCFGYCVYKDNITVIKIKEEIQDWRRRKQKSRCSFSIMHWVRSWLCSTKLFLRTYNFSAFTLNRKIAHLSFEKATVDLLFSAQGFSNILLNTLLIVVSKWIHYR